MKRMMMAVLGATMLIACGAEEKEAGDCADGVTVEITDNHRTAGGDHKLEIPADDVTAGDEQTYDIRGDNTGHTHSVTVTAEDFNTLQDGKAVTIESSDTGAAGNDHTHDIVLTC